MSGRGERGGDCCISLDWKWSKTEDTKNIKEHTKGTSEKLFVQVPNLWATKILWGRNKRKSLQQMRLMCLSSAPPPHPPSQTLLSHTHREKRLDLSWSVNRQHWRACVSDRAVKWLYKHDKLFPNIIPSAECTKRTSLLFFYLFYFADRNTKMLLSFIIFLSIFRSTLIPNAPLASILAS